jgi:hypothetical protein
MAGCGAAALGGIAAANWIRKEAQPVLSPIALPTALLMTGVMLIGRANSFSDVPLVSYLLVPLGAVALWPARTGLAAGRWRRGARWFLPVLVAAAAAIIALAVEGTGGDEW